jgi:hypothetical protein
MKIAASLWLSVVIAALVAITNYSNTPGSVGAVPAQWPTQTQIPLDGSRPTLIMFVHPHCPCTQASVGELEQLMANCQNRLNVRVVFVQLPGTTEDWVKTDLWRRVAAIPGLTAQRDANGIEAQRFQAETSGFTVLYNPKGTLLFAGGITIARGHSGDNPGRGAIETILAQGVPSLVTTPVFGCSLFGTECQKGVTP